MFTFVHWHLLVDETGFTGRGRRKLPEKDLLSCTKALWETELVLQADRYNPSEKCCFSALALFGKQNLFDRNDFYFYCLRNMQEVIDFLQQ